MRFSNTGITIFGSGFGISLCLFASAWGQQRPSPMGVPGGNAESVNNSPPPVFCCGGSLGALVQDSKGVQYVLGANHVLARIDIFEADPIVQPSPTQQSCQVNLSTTQIGKLDINHIVGISYVSDAKNVVDAALADVQAGTVTFQQGTQPNLSTQTLDVTSLSIGLPVQKVGGISGTTTGTIKEIDQIELYKFARGGTLNGVMYTGAQEAKWCNLASISVNDARFVQQILVKADTGAFVQPGDSGSLVTTRGSCPMAVGLLVASSDANPNNGLVNPITAVLSQLGASVTGGTTFDMVGNCTAGAEQTTSPETSNPYQAESDNAKQVLKNNSQWLLSIPGVESLGLLLNDNNQVAITVNVADANTVASVQKLVPSEIEGVPLVVRPPQHGTGL